MYSSENRIDAWISDHKEEIVVHIKQLIHLQSISTPCTFQEYPFGSGCASALDYMLQLAGDLGLATKNYDYYCGSAVLQGRTDRTIGIFVHLDTTPVSDMWLQDPFEAVERNGYIIGIGSEDNKGAAVSMLYLLRCLKDLEITLDHTILVVFGCGKKAKMEDMDHFLRHEKAPDLSLVADASFPVCIGEKGSANFELTCPIHDEHLVDFRSGLAANMIPGCAFALLKNFTFEEVMERLDHDSRCVVIPVDSYVKIDIGGLGGHAAFPEGSRSPIPLLADILLSHQLVGTSAPYIRFLRETYQTYDGVPFGLNERDETFGYSTHICGTIGIQHGSMRQVINVRYISQLTGAEVSRRVQETAGRAGINCRLLSDTPPHTPEPCLKPLTPVLTSIVNHVLGTSLHEYTMGGVTYAQKLPNAISFGPNRDDLPTPLGWGRGHMANEAVRIQDLLNALKIYALSLHRIDPMF